MEDLPILRLTRREFRELREYSCSIPTGTTPGKRWKRLDGAFDPHCKQPRWMIGEYGDLVGKNEIMINWYRPIITMRASTSEARP
ncbi:hypothetical protein [Methylosinus sp. PW1]|uniref:hypothetical protein n=1 Tax=Methylosinus sp. PW1 TaxID=107636 RepID=UPI0005634DE8|nr:hypothetical protein [Methylosinus sp. PW1]